MMVDRVAEGTARAVHLMREATQRARSQGRPVLASWSERVPWIHALTIFDTARKTAYDELFYWEHPNRCLATVGVGISYAVGGHDADRFSQAQASWHELLDGAVVDSDFSETELTGPVALGGFSFDPERSPTSLWDCFPAGRLVLPRLMLTTTETDAWVTTNRILYPHSDLDGEIQGATTLRAALLAADRHQALQPMSMNPATCPLAMSEDMPAADWQKLVAKAARSIRAGRLEKLVLARSVHISGGTFDPHTILSRLRASHPGCIIFAVSQREKTFLGATPEQLVRLRAGAVEASALAGTRRRGRDEQEDTLLGQELLSSPKDRSEHALVVQTIAEQLSGICNVLTVPDHPVLLKLRQVQHLHTPITGRLATSGGILDLVERLHPTPAVGGVPQDAAMDFLRRREGLDRGWYAAPVGWVDRQGEGEFAVALRSALLYDRSSNGSLHQAALFAGCGIMGDSDPASEYAESRAKLAAMLSVLGA